MGTRPSPVPYPPPEEWPAIRERLLALYSRGIVKLERQAIADLQTIPTGVLSQSLHYPSREERMRTAIRQRMEEFGLDPAEFADFEQWVIDQRLPQTQEMAQTVPMGALRQSLQVPAIGPTTRLTSACTACGDVLPHGANFCIACGGTAP